MRTNFRVKLVFLSIFFCLGFSLCKAQQNWGIGVKLGDPLGVSIKKYSGKNAVELIFGRTYYWGSYNYDYHFYHDNRFKNKSFTFGNTYNYSRPIALQLHYLIHKDFSQINELKWYVGFGGQFRYNHYYYNYWDQNGIYTNERVNDIGIGADGVIGLEYTFEDVPISLALDTDIYVEIFDRPLLLLFQAGLAARYNF